MRWWESFVATVTLLTVFGLLRWKPSAPAAPSSPPSSHSSPPTDPRRTLLADADPRKVGHDSICEVCRSEVIVSMAETRVERRPWRLVWRCSVCGSQSRARCPDELVPTFTSWDRAYGTSISMRELVEFMKTDLSELEKAVKGELL